MKKKQLQLSEGLRESGSDSRDFTTAGLISWPKLSELPQKYAIPPLSIKNQLAAGFDDGCASCAGTGMIEPKEEVELFFPFLFAAAKRVSGKDPNEWGLRIEDVAKGLQKYGVPEVQDVPDEIRSLDPSLLRNLDTYPQAVIDAAAKHKIKSYFVVEGPYDSYDNVRAAMWYFRNVKQFIIFGVKWGWNLSDFELTGTPEGFGHAMWSNGWFDSGLSAVNSAGKEAGRGGVHSLTRESFNAYSNVYKAIMCIDLPVEDARDYYLANGITLEDNLCTAFIKAIGVWGYLKRLFKPR